MSIFQHILSIFKWMIAITTIFAGVFAFIWFIAWLVTSFGLWGLGADLLIVVFLVSMVAHALEVGWIND